MREIDVSQAIDNLVQEGVAKKQLIIGEVTQVCQKMGCWMILTAGETFARVDFNNHSFLIPKSSKGSAQVFGMLKEVTLTSEQKEHYESEGAVLPTAKMYEITADSVKIFNNKS